MQKSESGKLAAALNELARAQQRHAIIAETLKLPIWMDGFLMPVRGHKGRKQAFEVTLSIYRISFL